jgi:hypothetical protein
MICGMRGEQGHEAGRQRPQSLLVTFLVLALGAWGCAERPGGSGGRDALVEDVAADGPAAGRDGLPDGLASHFSDGPLAQAGDGLSDGLPSKPDGVSPGGAAEQYPYDPVKFAFRQKIPPGIASDPRSAAIVARLDLNSSLVKVGLSDEGEVPPVYVVKPSDLLYSITISDGTKTSFRVPAGAVPGGGADFPLVLLDRLHPVWGPFTELRLWQAKVDSGARTLQASGSGLFHYNRAAAPWIRPRRWRWGCGFSSMPRSTATRGRCRARPRRARRRVSCASSAVRCRSTG